jgi:hypothetical protein
MKNIIRSTFCFVAIIILSFSAHSQNVPNVIGKFQKIEAMIKMRDGIRLYTMIFVPKDMNEPLPFLLTRTPYGIGGAPNVLNGYLKELTDDGYIIVFQDIRGRYKSEGKFVMQRPLRDKSDPKAIDESTDTYDTIDWLLKNISNNNGRVGVLGISYGGWLTVMAMIDPHPALKAVSEQATPADMYLGDDFHHNGAFRLSYGFEYSFEMEYTNVDTVFKFDNYDTYEWYLKLGPLSNVNEKYFHNQLPTWNNFVNHPNYDKFWQQQALVFQLTNITVPNLNVAGWWDQEDFYGPMKTYDVLERTDNTNLNYLVVGPWNHGGWSRGEGKNLGKIEFDSPTSKYFREKIQAPWFTYFLKGKGNLNQPEALSFRTGSNTWETYSEWPPRKNIVDKKLYFHKNGILAFDQPKIESDNEFDSYVSDPDHPVPYRPRPIEPTYGRDSRWYIWLVEDQRFVHLRPDVLSWETEPLNEDVIIAGNVTANLFASTTGTDCDWIVKLIDVYPEEYSKNPSMGGYQLMVSNEVFRSRFRKSFENPEPVEPNKVNEYNIDLHSRDHCFNKGHKIMVQVQSTWFPVIDRNPQKYVENIFTAKESDYQSATQRVYRTNRYSSNVKIPVLVK